MSEHCDYCSGRLDRPGHLLCDNTAHPKPTKAQFLALKIEDDLDGRRGFHMGTLPNDIRDSILDKWEQIILSVYPVDTPS